MIQVAHPKYCYTVIPIVSISKQGWEGLKKTFEHKTDILSKICVSPENHEALIESTNVL